MSNIITSDVPATPQPRSEAYKQFVQRVKEEGKRAEGYPALCCGVCGELLHAYSTGWSCRNGHDGLNIGYVDPIVKYFCYYPSACYRDFCVSPDPHGEQLVFKPMRAAEWFKANMLWVTDRETKILFYYNPDLHKWCSDGETYLHTFLAQTMKEEYKPVHYINVLDSLKAITYDKIVFSQKIAVENGLLNLESGLLEEFIPNEMPFYSLPVKYDPSAESTLWETFVSQVVSPDDSALMQEWAGYCLLPSYPKHKFLFCYGTGRNGKGVFDRTLQGILGASNCATLRLEELNGDRRFALARFYGKLYISSPEPLVTKDLQTPILKSLTGEDTQNAELKMKQETLQFVNTAKITVYGNRYPRVNDNTDAFYDRLEILEFPNRYVNGEQTDNLENTWLSCPTDKSGILNWMLTGLKRLMQNGCFTTSKSQNEKVLELKKISDPFSAFIEECTEYTPREVKNYVTREEMYTAFIEYCEGLGAKALSNSAFTQNMKALTRVRDKEVQKPKHTRVWEGIKLKEQTESSTDSTDSTLPSYEFFSEHSNNKEGEVGVESVEGVDSLAVDKCSLACVNFRGAACPSRSAFYRGLEAGVPLKCGGYKPKSRLGCSD